MHGVLTHLVRHGGVAAILGLSFLTAACGPLPHPFEHEVAGALVEDHMVGTTLGVAPVESLPGFDKLIVKSLEQEDVPARMSAPVKGGWWLRGVVQTDKGLVWTLQDLTGNTTGQVTIPMASGTPTASQKESLAQASAVAIAKLLRTEGQGAAKDGGPGGADVRLNTKVAASGVLPPPVAEMPPAEPGKDAESAKSGPSSEAKSANAANAPASVPSEPPSAATGARVRLLPVKATKGFDADGLRMAMSRALLSAGYKLDDAADTPFVIQGDVHVTPAPADVKSGRDMLDVVWLVKSAKGKELGKVSQGSPVDHMLLTGFIGSLGRAISEAAIPAIKEVIEKKGSP